MVMRMPLTETNNKPEYHDYTKVGLDVAWFLLLSYLLFRMLTLMKDH